MLTGQPVGTIRTETDDAFLFFFKNMKTEQFMENKSIISSARQIYLIIKRTPFKCRKHANNGLFVLSI